ncbi:MAG: hypothetical protein EAZ33_17255 [Oscillatoriales cyanobacterium]|nr:MAG: hypothetical protein EAZ33_17255 [Oscillatoriales cyanobacterium]
MRFLVIIENYKTDREFQRCYSGSQKDSTSPRIYPWNQSQIENRKSSLPPNLSVGSPLKSKI